MDNSNNNNHNDDNNGMCLTVLQLANIRGLACIQRCIRTVIGHVYVISKLWATHCVLVIFVIPFGWNSMQEHSSEVSPAFHSPFKMFLVFVFLYKIRSFHLIIINVIYFSIYAVRSFFFLGILFIRLESILW